MATPLSGPTQRFGHSRQTAQSPGIDLAGLMSMIQQSQGNFQMPQLGGLGPAKGMNGQVIAPGQPTGLDRWYANNPNARQGEFDPGGRATALRGAQVRALDDGRLKLDDGLLKLDNSAQQDMMHDDMIKRMQKALKVKGMMAKYAKDDPLDTSGLGKGLAELLERIIPKKNPARFNNVIQ
jgi:hypothetical protein